MHHDKFKRISQFTFVFLAALFICSVITGVYVNNKNKMEYAQMEQVVLMKSNKVNNVISNMLYKTQVLSALVIQNNGKIKDFERVAVTVLDNPAIKNLILAPNGVVADVYPLAGNEQVIGLNYFAHGEGNEEAKAAKESGQLVLGGPFNLIQGGQALVGRLPVYLGDNQTEKNFWGVVSITLNYPEALAGAELEQLEAQGLAFEIWRISPDTGQRQIIANSNYFYDKNAYYVEKPLNIMNSQWFFRISPIRLWYQYTETWMFTLIGIVISWLIASLVLHNRDLIHMKMELENLSYVDPLTGALNRRGLFNALEALVADKNRKFTVCYLDLNKFKKINDTFGHSVGDKILRHFVLVFLQHIDERHIFSRIGGDEFIIIFKNMDDTVQISQFFDLIHKVLQEPFSINQSQTFTITFSVGMATYPTDATNIDDLIHHADHSMYRNKV